ncbi:MAG: hypothetical protein C0444_10400 [Microbacterium sp.]|nr:hypothetical protein [Microbacterium sp.]MBA4345578.1 hypothetical protein [Microbacterium sp.]
MTLTDKTYARGPAGLNAYNLRNRKTGQVEHLATPARRVFGSNSILRSYTEILAQGDSKATSMHEFSSPPRSRS